MKTGSPTLGFQHPAANIPHIPPPQPPLQRTAIQRHQARRSGQFLPKLAPGQSNSDARLQASPKGHATSSSLASSPTSIAARSPMTMQQDGFNSPTSSLLAQAQNFQSLSRGPHNQPFYQPQQMSPNTQRPTPPVRHQSGTSIMSNHSASGRPTLTTATSAGLGTANSEAPASQLYSEPFQKHFDQLGESTDAARQAVYSSS